MDRRSFVKGTIASGMSFMVAPSLLRAKTGPKHRTVLIGSGWWGMNIATVAIESGQCDLVAVCDVDKGHLEGAAARVEKLTGRTPKKYNDFRECLAQEKADIAIVATPDHWHPLCTIAAVQAGAHVYVEKPIGHTVYEGTAMVKAARQNNRVVQVGTHRRVSPHNMSGMKFLKDGKAGDIGMVRCFVHYGGGAGEPTPDSEVPAGLDWDMWCGPAPLRPFNKRMHPKGFRRFMDYANGQLGDWGIHWLDQVLWWTEEKYPKTVSSTAARHILRDNSDCPDTQVVQYEFESFTCTWEHRLYAANSAEKHNIGAYFYGTKGTFHMGWQDGWTFYPANSRDPIIHENPQLNKPDDQNIRELWADFLGCIETGKRPVCDIEIGHRSTNLALLGMLSHKAGRSIKWDGQKEIIVGDAEASKLLKREYRKPWVYPES
ncbi:MAG: Gfo/Idh/MocA family oxidoreductase [Phycisphaerae bacterium]|nr:Gfo/Idh/MocA family oxidoreductase [Phycisphaerae bacterium]